MKTLNLRLPDELHERLKAAAETDRRSINNFLINLLEKSCPRLDATPFDLITQDWAGRRPADALVEGLVVRHPRDLRLVEVGEVRVHEGEVWVTGRNVKTGEPIEFQSEADAWIHCFWGEEEVS